MSINYNAGFISLVKYIDQSILSWQLGENFKEGIKFQNSKTSISPSDETCLYTEVKIQLLGGRLEKGFKPKLARWSPLIKFYIV